MVGSIQATKQHIANAVVFVLLFFGPLIFTSFVPDARFSQIIDNTKGAVLLLGIAAGFVSGLLAWVFFRANVE